MLANTRRSKWYRDTVIQYDKKKKLLQVRVMCHSLIASPWGFPICFCHLIGLPLPWVWQYDDSDVSWYTMSEKTFRWASEWNSMPHDQSHAVWYYTCIMWCPIMSCSVPQVYCHIVSDNVMVWCPIMSCVVPYTVMWCPLLSCAVSYDVMCGVL